MQQTFDLMPTLKVYRTNANVFNVSEEHGIRLKHSYLKKILLNLLKKLTSVAKVDLNVLLSYTHPF